MEHAHTMWDIKETDMFDSHSKRVLLFSLHSSFQFQNRSKIIAKIAGSLHRCFEGVLKIFALIIFASIPMSAVSLCRQCPCVGSMYAVFIYKKYF